MGKRGPAPKPSSVRIAGRRHSRELGLDIEPSRPPCPEWLSKPARAEWRRVVPHLERLGLLTELDRATLANYCVSWAEWVDYQAGVEKYGAVLPVKHDDGSTTLQKSPYVALAREARDRMMRAAAQFGFSPSARVGLKAHPNTVAARPEIAPISYDDTRSILRVLEGGA